MTEQDRVFGKCAWRLVPFMALLYVVNYIDRVNVGFAALTMNKELGLSPSIYGFGAGIFFFSYALCQIPASLMIARIGPRRGIFWILVIWGALSAANAFVWSPASFYVVRFFLGIAEAGFFPGMVFYLTLWFPKDYLGRSIAGFQAANPLAFVVAGPLSGLLLGMDGAFSLSGWQWLFLAEGLPACILAFAVYRWMPDGPADASWLDRDEKAAIASRHRSDGVAEHSDIRIALKDWRVFGIGFVGIGVIFCITGVQLWVPQIVQAMGFPNETVGVVVALPFVCGSNDPLGLCERFAQRTNLAHRVGGPVHGTGPHHRKHFHFPSARSSRTDDRDRWAVFRAAGHQHAATLAFARTGAGWRNRRLQHHGAVRRIFRSDCDWRSQTGDEQLCGRPYCVGGSRDLVGGGHSSPRPRAFAARRVRKHRPRIAKPCDRATEGSR
jgi:MFS family permease